MLAEMASTTFTLESVRNELEGDDRRFAISVKFTPVGLGCATRYGGGRPDWAVIFFIQPVGSLGSGAGSSLFGGICFFSWF